MGLYPSTHHLPVSARILVACGALLAAGAVALSAYAAHAVQGVDQQRLHSAALFAFGHGIALAALVPRRPRGFRTIALFLLLLGTLVFSGSLAGAVFAGLPTRFAPIGGSLMILAWVLYAIDALRR
ncbi:MULTISPECIES: DUF423 domain-containing protein [unclassified Lysobacter]|uniref:DUF423 domain-containing protein n=1 Tax=unclassified Lysobacter TaxID=2635362 RepID=UPI001C235BA2|nr:DUF423 domain-containing protein [Lysobacter sp. MMG2]MBU8975161.1 DUF423 domain-containing protein [Lysobacter sp. MMG2]